ncbi:uncharacterized protein HMPREF1541_05984 [Cyphellophora europaea CBS 101466]|uniref:SAP domain-containing protein n=1 Tax=Cyphellophora europaea (strain CBS 101466) TaxID=1220924 RepID=W2RVF6_CYPE1|nr:uncharacterized protein HMPREF1541_05984 [Cyphellophora europaea CBS 101466]ETN39758.1 hypothetical protein HMPREF1541_05984 [Cyphellophora europaea CBS 101466]
MVDYARETVAKLQEILKSRQLPTSGKKAELIERLRAADQAAEASGTHTHSSGISSPSSQLTYPAEAEAAPPAPAVTSAPPQQTPETIVQKPTAPESGPADTTETVTESVAQPAAGDAASTTDATLAASASYSLQLPTSNIDDELAKRKARAARFGTSTETATAEDPSAEQTKALERAKRFGVEQSETAIGKLDGALSNDGPKGRRRGPAKDGEAAANDDPGLLRRGRGGRFRGRGRSRREGSAGARPTGVDKRSALSSVDRAAAEARKQRFAQQG